MADRDKGKEKALEPLEVGIKRKKMENTSDGQDDAEAAAAGKKLEAKEDTVLSASEEILEGAEAEYSTEETVISTSDEFDVLCSRSPVLLSPTESSTNNPPKGIKKKNVNVEQAAADEELILSPKESSTNVNPKGMKRVRQEEEEEEEDKKKKLLKAADSLSDTGTSKFPTSPIDKFMDSSDKDDQSMRSPPGDQGSSHRKNL